MASGGRRGRVLALDLGAVVVRALERVAVDERDGQHPVGERDDRAGLLVGVGHAIVVGVVGAVLDPVVVGVGIAGVGAVVELADVRDAVAVGVGRGLVDAELVLPAVRDAVVV